MPKDVPKKENGSSAVPLRASAQSSGGAMSKLRQSGVKLLQKTAQRLNMREEAVTAGTSLHGKSGSSSTISDSSGADRERMENETTHGEAGKNGHQEPEVGASESKPYMESSKAGKQPHEVKRTRKPHPEPKRPYQREKKAVPPNKLDSKKPVTQPNDVKKHQTPQQTEPKKTGVPQPDGKRPGHPNTPARSASWDVSSPGPSCQPCSEDRQPSVERNTNACTSGAAGSTAGISRSVRPSAVRHRDRGAAKVSFSTCVEMLGPPGGGPSAATEAAEVAEAASAVLQEDEETSARQAESLRKLEQENESLRHAIENYRELERKRNASLSENKPSSGSDAAGQEDALTTNEEGEEDEIEKAIEVSPDGTFLKFSEEIGRGSFKTVYKGLDTTTGVFVAWCELQVVGARLSRKERDRFREEADLMKGLTHPNIVRFYDYWEVDKPKKGCIVLVTELMTSGTLRTYLKNFGQKKVSLKIIKQWCRQILRGLQFLHSRNPPIIHRDLKCDNIFISGTTGQVKVGDLGLATLKNRSFAKSVIGTPEFMAPEVYEEHYDEAVDVYAFGMCMLEMVTAEYPYSECTGPAQIYKKVVAGIKPSSLEKVEDAQVRELIEWCTGLVSQQRPTVKQLLTHQFFAEDCGMRLDIANREETVGSDRNVVELQLRVLDAKKRRDTHKENEAIQFNYVLNKDNPEETAKQMVMSGLLAEENWRPVAKMIVNQIQSLVRAREEKRREQGAPGQTQSTPAATVAATPAGAAAHASVSLPTLAPSSAQTPQQPPPAAPAAAPPSAAHAQSLQQLSGAEAAVTAAAAEEKGSEPQQQQAGTGTANPAEVAADGAVSTESEPGLSEKKERKGRARRRKTCERLPRLTVLEVKSRENGPVVSCLLETNQSQAITFKFDLREADVSAISYKMTELHLLPRDDAQYFEEQLRAVISQQLQAERSEQPAPPAEDQCDASGAGAAATSSGGSPLRRPADLAAPATGASQARRQSRFIVSSVVESKPPPSPSSALHSPATESVPFLLPAAAAAVVSAPPSQQAAVLSPASESSEPAQNSHLDSLLDGSDRTASHTPSLPLSTATTPLQVPTAPTPLMSPVVEPTETRPASGVGVSGAVTSTPVSTGAVFKTPAARPPKTFKVTPANAAPPFGTPSVSPEGAAPAQNAAVTPSAAPQPGVAGDKAAGGGMSGVSPHWTGVPAQLPNASQRTVLDGPPPRPAANGSVQHTVQPGNAQNSAEASVPDVSPMVPQVSSANQLPSSVSQNRESPTAWSGLAATAQQPSGAGHQPIPPTCLIPAPPQNNQPAASAGSLVYVVDSLSLKPPVLSETPKAGDVQPLWAAPNGASVPASATPTAPTTAQTTLPSSAGQPSLSPASSTACVPPLAGGGAAVASSASPSPSAAPTAGSALAQTQGGMTAGSSRAAEVPPTLPKSSPSPLGMSAPVAMVSASEGLPSDTAPVAAEAKVPAGSVLTNGAAAPLTTPPMATSLAAVPATLQAPAAPTGGLVTPTGGVAVSRFTAGPSAGPSRSLTSLQPAQAELATPAGATPKQPVTLEGQSSVGNLAHLAEQLTKLTSQPAEVAPPSSAAADGTDPSRRVASAAASATPSAPLRTGDGSGASAARAAAEPGATPQSASDGSRPTSAADTPGGGRKPPPLLLSDLAKELSKIHGKPHLPHVTSTPLLGALEDAAEAAPVSDTVGAPDTGRAPLQLPPSAQHGTANSQSAPAPPAPQCWQQGSVLAQSQPRPADGQAPAQPAAAAAVLPAQPAARPLTPAQAAPADPLTVPAAVAGLPGPAAALPAQRPAATPEDVRAAAPGPPAAPAPAAAAAPTPVSDNAGSPVHRGRFAISPVSVPPPVGVVASPGAAEAAEATAAPSASLSGTSAAAAQTSDASVGPCSLGETVGSAYHQLLLAVEDTEQYKELLARQQADLAHLQRQQEIERELLRRELRHQQLSAARRRQKEDPAG